MWPEHAEEIAQLAASASAMRRWGRVTKLQQERITELEAEVELAHAANRELHAELCDLVDHTDATCTVVPERDRYRLAWLSARAGRKLLRGAWRYEQWRMESQAEEMREQDSFARSLWGMLTERRQERDRYRSAWLSARRGRAKESEYAAEALAMKDAEIARLVDDVTRAEAFVAEVQTIRGWTMCGETYRTHLRPIYDALHELESAGREGRPYRDEWTRNGPERMADMCPACYIAEDQVPQPAPCLCGDEAATVAYWRANLQP
jgi:hypothetical protein